MRVALTMVVPALQVKAKSKFWYFIRLFKRIKRANGEIMSCNEVSSQLVLRVDARIAMEPCWKVRKSGSCDPAAASSCEQLRATHYVQRELAVGNGGWIGPGSWAGNDSVAMC